MKFGRIGPLLVRSGGSGLPARRKSQAALLAAQPPRQMQGPRLPDIKGCGHLSPRSIRLSGALRV